MTSIAAIIITSSQTIDNSYEAYLVDASNGNLLITLMDISEADGETFYVKRIDNSANSVTIQGINSSQTIDGQTSTSFSYNQSFRIVALNSIWYSIINGT